MMIIFYCTREILSPQRWLWLTLLSLCPPFLLSMSLLWGMVTESLFVHALVCIEIGMSGYASEYGPLYVIFTSAKDLTSAVTVVLLLAFSSSFFFVYILARTNQPTSPLIQTIRPAAATLTSTKFKSEKKKKNPGNFLFMNKIFKVSR